MALSPAQCRDTASKAMAVLSRRNISATARGQLRVWYRQIVGGLGCVVEKGQVQSGVHAAVKAGKMTARQGATILGVSLSEFGDYGVGVEDIPVIGGAVDAARDGVVWLTKNLIPLLKVAAGGALLLFVFAAMLVVMALGSDTAAAAGSTARKVNVAGRAARRVAGNTERGQARKIAAKTRATNKTERARTRVVTESTRSGRERVRVSSRRDAADARQQDAEHRAQRGQRDRERLAALRMEQRRRREAPPLHSKERNRAAK